MTRQPSRFERLVAERRHAESAPPLRLVAPEAIDQRSVLEGESGERYELAVAGAEGHAPLRPIFVRPGVRPDPRRRRPVRIAASVRAILAYLAAAFPGPLERTCGAVMALVGLWLAFVVLPQIAAFHPPASAHVDYVIRSH